jgi:hypothetical protein
MIAPPAYIKAPNSALPPITSHGVSHDGPDDEAALALALDNEFQGSELTTLQIEFKKATMTGSALNLHALVPPGNFIQSNLNCLLHIPASVSEWSLPCQCTFLAF